MGSRGSKSENISSARALFYTNANLQDITYPGDNGYFTTDKPVLKNVELENQMASYLPRIQELEEEIRNEGIEWAGYHSANGFEGPLTSGESGVFNPPPHIKPRLKNSIFTHNHPNSSPLSDADIRSAAYYDMAEMRCTGTGKDGKIYTHRLIRPIGGWPKEFENSTNRELFSTEHEKLREQLANWLTREVTTQLSEKEQNDYFDYEKEGNLTREAVFFAYGTAANVIAANKLGARYVIEIKDPKTNKVEYKDNLGEGRDKNYGLPIIPVSFKTATGEELVQHAKRVRKGEAQANPYNPLTTPKPTPKVEPKPVVPKVEPTPKPVVPKPVPVVAPKVEPIPAVKPVKAIEPKPKAIAAKKEAPKSKVAQLAEAKSLYDNGKITKAEYNKKLKALGLI